MVGTPQAQSPTIRDLEIEGTSELEASQLLLQLESSIGSPIDRRQISRDLHTIFETGNFVDARVEAEALPDADGYRLRFVVLERPRITTLEVQGIRAISRDETIGLMTLKQLDTYDPAKVQQNIRIIQDAYRKKGFNRVRITPEVKELSPTERSLVFQVEECPADRGLELEARRTIVLTPVGQLDGSSLLLHPLAEDATEDRDRELQEELALEAAGQRGVEDGVALAGEALPVEVEAGADPRPPRALPLGQTQPGRLHGDLGLPDDGACFECTRVERGGVETRRVEEGQCRLYHLDRSCLGVSHGRAQGQKRAGVRRLLLPRREELLLDGELRAEHVDAGAQREGEEPLRDVEVDAPG
ncbi:MAG: POTRA domain-containing protein, partial [Burkholderiaceae bacterium]